MALLRARRGISGPVEPRLAREGERPWLWRAGLTFLRQAAVAVILFGLVSFVVATDPPYRPLVTRAARYAARADHTYDDVVAWVIGLRDIRVPDDWDEVREVFWSWRGAPAAESDGQASNWAMVWPVAGEITSGFGWRTHPVHNDLRYHTGVDIGAPEGTEVVAVRPGTVVETGHDDTWGNYVVVRHDPEISTFYAHLATIVVVADQQLDRGRMVGTVGRTGTVSEAHLHFELREKDLPVDPEPLLRAGRNG